MPLTQEQVTNYVKIGPATKATYEGGGIVYRWPDGKVEIIGNDITISRLSLGAKDDSTDIIVDYTLVIDKYGSSIPEELVDYWFNNDFFLIDPAEPLSTVSEPENTKMEVVGDISYIAFAAPGTAWATPAWKVMKVDETIAAPLEMNRTWADGGRYTQVATDLTSLTYS